MTSIPPDIEIFTFGPLRVEREGEPLLPSGSKQALLAAYLALEPRPVSREDLAVLFWPGRSRKSALHSLRQMLWSIRRALGDAVVADNGNVTIVISDQAVDARRLAVALAEGRIDEVLEARSRGGFLAQAPSLESWELQEWVEATRLRIDQAIEGWIESHLAEIGKGPLPADPRLLSTVAAGLDASELRLQVGSALSERGEVVALGPLLDRLRADGMDEEAAALQRRAFEAGAQTFEPRVGAGPEGPTGVDRGMPPDQSEVEPDGNAEGSRGDLPPGGAEEGPQPAEKARSTRRRSFTSLATLGTAAVVLWTGARMFQGGETAATLPGDPLLSPDPAEARAAVMAELGTLDYEILFCSDRDGPGHFSYSRMAPDGYRKHRITPEDSWTDAAHGCAAVILTEAGIGLFRVLGPDGEPTLLTLEPNPDNLIQEWTPMDPWRAPFPSNPSLVGPGTRTDLLRTGPLLMEQVGSAGSGDIFAVFPASGEVRRLTDHPADDRNPVLGPEGRWVYFDSDRSGSGDLYRVPLEGGEAERITDHPLQDATPVIRGTTLLFVRGRGKEEEDGNMELVTLDMDTGAERYLTDNGWNDYEVRWSSDGLFICWQSEELGHYEAEIMGMNLETGETFNVSESPGRDSSCRWGPDSRTIFFETSRDGDRDIYARILRSPEEGSSPRPVGPAVDLSRYSSTDSFMSIILGPLVGQP
jgi:hypothetical protein